MDRKCMQCGEPWESHYIRDEMEPEDRARFNRGEGCEACGFGTRVSHTASNEEIEDRLNSHGNMDDDEDMDDFLSSLPNIIRPTAQRAMPVGILRARVNARRGSDK